MCRSASQLVCAWLVVVRNRLLFKPWQNIYWWRFCRCRGRHNLEYCMEYSNRVEICMSRLWSRWMQLERTWYASWICRWWQWRFFFHRLSRATIPRCKPHVVVVILMHEIVESVRCTLSSFRLVHRCCIHSQCDMDSEPCLTNCNYWTGVIHASLSR